MKRKAVTGEVLMTVSIERNVPYHHCAANAYIPNIRNIADPAVSVLDTAMIMRKKNVIKQRSHPMYAMDAAI